MLRKSGQWRKIAVMAFVVLASLAGAPQAAMAQGKAISVQGAGAASSVQGQVRIQSDRLGQLSEAAQATLQSAAVEGIDSLLVAVEAIVSKYPHLADIIVEQATALAPEMRAEILTAATSGLRTAQRTGQPGTTAKPPPIPREGAGAGALVVAAGLGAAGIAALAAGGGGSSGGAGDPEPLTIFPPEQITDPEDFETSEYFNSSIPSTLTLDLIGASTAYSHGATGDGVVVAVIDSGAQLDHPELASQFISDGINAITGVGNAEEATDSHGTWVSGVIAAKQDEFAMHGVAYDAKIFPVKILGDSDAADLLSFGGTGVHSGSGNYALSNGSGFVPHPASALTLDETLELAYNASITAGASIINNSWGLVGIDDSNLPINIFTDGDIEDSFPLALEALRNAIDAGAIIIFSAGNANADHVNVMAGLPVLFPELESQWLAVMSVNKDGEKSGFSDKCGMAQDFCMAAYGGESGFGDGGDDFILTTGLGSGYDGIIGTSFSAPLVAGAVAVLKDAYPMLSSEQIVQLLKQSATDIGVAGVDPVYGHGLMNLANAFNPMGIVLVPVSSGGAVGLAETGFSGGGSLGNIATTSLSHTLGAQDSFGRYFDMHFAHTERTGALTEGRLASYGLKEDRRYDLGGGLSLSYAPAPEGKRQQPAMQGVLLSLKQEDATYHMLMGRDAAAAFTSLTRKRDEQGESVLNHVGRHPYIALLGKESWGGLNQFGTGETGEVTLFSGFGRKDEDSENYHLAVASNTSVDLHDKARLLLSSGALVERESVLGAAGSGALATGDSVTQFAGLGFDYDLSDDLSLFGQAHYGWTQLYGRADSLFSEDARLTSNAFALGMTARNLLADSDRLGFSISQPLRVSDGHTQFHLATGQNRDGSLIFENRRIDLTPTGREIALEASYLRRIGVASQLSFGAAYRIEPDHEAEAAPELIGIMRFNHRF